MMAQRETQLRSASPTRLRAVLRARLRSTGGSADEAARRLGVSRTIFDALLQLVGEPDMPTRIRAEVVVELPQSREFCRWFNSA